MSSRRRRQQLRHRAGLAAFFLGLAVWLLTACGFVLDFDDFDATRPTPISPADDASTPVPTVVVPNPLAAKDFKVTVPQSIRIGPGYTLTFPVFVEWFGDGVAQTVSFAITRDEREEVFEPIEPIESVSESNADAGGGDGGLIAVTSMRVAVSSTATPQERVLHGVATTSGRPPYAFDIKVQVWGEACSFDRSFGIEGRVATSTYFAPIPMDGGVFRPLIQHDPQRGQLFALTGVVEDLPDASAAAAMGLASSGKPDWRASLNVMRNDPRPPLAMTIAKDGLYVASSLHIERFDLAEGDASYPTTPPDGLPPKVVDCDLVSMATDPSDAGGAAILCMNEHTANGYWHVDRWNPDGKVAVGLAVDTSVPRADSLPRKLVQKDIGFIACGSVNTGVGPRIAVLRWIPSDADELQPDKSFGNNGRFAYSRRSQAITCDADGEGIVVEAFINSTLGLLAITNNGAVDLAFGDPLSGTSSLKAPVGGDGGTIEVSRLNDGGVFAPEDLGKHFVRVFTSLAKERKIAVIADIRLPPSKHAFLNEYPRDGHGEPFTCDLQERIDSTIVDVAFDDPFARAYILTESGAIYRVWL
jgi:hypothetical protein